MHTIIYKINREDRIIAVSDNWMDFARDNQATHTCHPDFVIDRPIMEFMAGEETLYLYSILVQKVRESQKPITFPFRCDSPNMRRFLEMNIRPLDEILEFRSSILREEPSETVDLLRIGTSRSDDFVRICSMCKKVDLSQGEWVEIEVAAVSMRLFEASIMPQLSHTICPQCYESVMAKINRL